MEKNKENRFAKLQVFCTLNTTTKDKKKQKIA